MNASPAIERASRLGAAAGDPSRCAGREPTDSPEFDRMMEQVLRFESSGEADWNEIARLATIVLERDGCDLRAAVHRAIALGRLSGWPGWSQGIATIAAILEHHWPDRIVPPPASSSRPLVALFRRLAERLVRWPSPERSEVAEAAVAVAALVAAVRSRWCVAGDPATDPFRDAGRAIVAALEPLATTLAAAAAPPPPEPTPAPPEAPRIAAAPSPRTVEVADADPGDAAAVERWVGQLADRQRSAALALLAHRPHDPRPYLLLRANAWSNAESVEIDGRTGALRIRPPEASEPPRELPDSPAPEDLVTAERRVAASPFWLDLTLRTAELLRRRGPQAAAARTAILSELASLLRRRPGLRAATFPDGRPILTLEIPALDGPPPTPSLVPPTSPPGADATPALRGRRDRFLEALAALERRPLDPLVTRSLCESLLDLAESTGLEEWEPSLAATLFERTLAANGRGERWERLHDRSRLGLARTAPDRLAGFPSREAAADR